MKNKYNILIVEPSEIVFEGLSTILTTGLEENLNIIKVDSLKDAFDNLKKKTFQVIIVNSIYFSNFKNTKHKILSIFKNQVVIGLLNVNIERGICDNFSDCIYINDDKRTIYSIIKKYLENTDSDTKINNDALSEREIEVLKLLVRGYANKEIAEELYISTHTVVTHRKNISKKIGMKSTAAMAIYAAANNIIDINTVLKNSK